MTKPLLQSKTAHVAIITTLIPGSTSKNMSFTGVENSRSLQKMFKLIIQDLITLSQRQNNSQPRQEETFPKSTRHIPPSARLAVLHRDGYKCTFCGCSAKQAELEVSNIINYPKGGSGYLSNLQTICVDCLRHKTK